MRDHPKDRGGIKRLAGRARRLLAMGLAALVLGPVGLHPREAMAGPAIKEDAPIQRNVFIPMRDGVRLATDIHMPRGQSGKRIPVVLIRTPYSKAAKEPIIPLLVRSGYAVAVQDKRGRFNSDGSYIPSGGDAEDGYDAVDWLARQSWSNGRIGAFGCSYSGDVQIFMAGLRHPALKAIIPQASGSSVGSLGGHFRYFGSRSGGAIELIQSIGWFSQNGQKHTPKLPTTLPQDAYNQQADLWEPPRRRRGSFSIEKAWTHLPTVDALRSQGLGGTDYEDTVSRPLDDPYWDALPYMTASYRSDVPALLVNSWNDFGADITMAQHQHLKATSVSQLARDNQFVVMSPHTHCAFDTKSVERTIVGERDLGDTRFDYFGMYLTWFDAWLKEDAAARAEISRWPQLRYYAMGRNQWQAAAGWPVPGAEVLELHLTSERGANGLDGDGRLRREPPRTPHRDTFVYDPQDPVPSRGGAMCCTGTAAALAGSVDQSPIQSRRDILVYSTEPLETDLEVTGEIAVVLSISSDAVDTDFTAKLTDVSPDGKAFNIAEGILRTGFRSGTGRYQPMKPGEIHEIKVSLGATSNVFLKGHRVRLEVSSSNFPRFDRNLNMGGNNALQHRWRKAVNNVHLGPASRSRLLLPVVARPTLLEARSQVLTPPPASGPRE